VCRQCRRDLRPLPRTGSKSTPETARADVDVETRDSYHPDIMNAHLATRTGLLVAAGWLLGGLHAACGAPTEPPAPLGSRRGPAHPQAADSPNGPDSVPAPAELIRSKWGQVLEVLQDPELDTAAKETRIETIAQPVIDFALMGKLALGRAHWGRLTAAQREIYLRRFEQRVKKSYREKIVLYEDQEVRIEFPQDNAADASGSSTAGRTGGGTPRTARVAILVLSKGKRATVLHKLRWCGDRWRIYDFEIEGVSILLTYRSQFDDILQAGSVEELLSRMQESPAG